MSVKGREFLETQLLMTIPGVSYYSALLIYAELGEINRFDSHKEVVSFMGLNPTIRESLVLRRSS